MHDGCIQSIYAVGLNLEACMRMIETNPKKAGEMIAHATASLSLVIQELRSFITGRKLQIVVGQNLRTEIEKAVQAAGYRGLTFTVDIAEDAMNALTPRAVTASAADRSRRVSATQSGTPTRPHACPCTSDEARFASR